MQHRRHSELKVVVDANKIVLDNIVVRVNSTRFVENVELIPGLTLNTNKERIKSWSLQA